MTRTGVLKYVRSDGTIQRELRLPEEVFAPASMASLQSAPITDGHKALVNAENWTQFSKGHVAEGTVRKDGALLSGDLIVQDAPVLTRIDNGELSDLSLGYAVREDRTPGVYEGQPYDLIQRDIRYNHVALLPPGGGRAGRECALRLDSSAAVVADTDTIKDPMKIRIDGKDYEFGSEEHVNAAVAAAVAPERTRADKATADADTQRARADKAEGELAVSRDPVRFDAAVKERSEVCAKAVTVLGASYKCDGKSNADIMRDAVRASDKSVSEDKLKSDVYTQARFDGLSAAVVTTATPSAADLLTAGIVREDAAPDAEAARKAMLETNRSLCKVA